MLNIFTVVSLFGLLSFSTAWSDSTSTFGFGSNQVSLAGAGKAKPQDGYSVMTNPSLMSSQESTTASFGLTGTYDAFADVDNIVVDNTWVGGSGTTYGKISNNIPEAYLMQAGLVIPLSRNEMKWRGGFAVQIPVDKMAEATTQDYYRPQYTLYQNDLQRIGLAFGFSAKPLEALTVGLGFQLYYKTAGNMVSKMPTGGNTSSVNTAMVLRPGHAPTLGVKYDASEAQAFTLTYAAARDYRIEFDVEAAMNILNNPSPLVFTSGGSLFYDAENVGLGYSYSTENWDYLAAVDYERWSLFDGGVFKVNFTTFTSNFSQYQFDTKFHDIWVPRLGVIHRFAGGDSLRVGLAYRPTPTPDLNQSMANFLDSDREILGVGYTFRLPQLLGIIDHQVDLATHLQIQHLNPRHVTKSPTAQTATPIGYPSYDINGNIFSYGLSLTTEI